jgi:integrase
MQNGSMATKARLEGADVWEFRWSEKGSNGRRVYRKRVVGTVDSYPNIEVAHAAVAGLIAEVNWSNLRTTSITMTIAQLVGHFEQRELGNSNTCAATRRNEVILSTCGVGSCQSGATTNSAM